MLKGTQVIDRLLQQTSAIRSENVQYQDYPELHDAIFVLKDLTDQEECVLSDVLSAVAVYEKICIDNRSIIESDFGSGYAFNIENGFDQVRRDLINASFVPKELFWWENKVTKEEIKERIPDILSPIFATQGHLRTQLNNIYSDIKRGVMENNNVFSVINYTLLKLENSNEKAKLSELFGMLNKSIKTFIGFFSSQNNTARYLSLVGEIKMLSEQYIRFSERPPLEESNAADLYTEAAARIVNAIATEMYKIIPKISVFAWDDVLSFEDHDETRLV